MVESLVKTKLELPTGWGMAYLNHNSSISISETRSYDLSGRVVRWIPPKEFKNYACDIEDSRTECQYLAKYFDIENQNFLKHWVVCEVIAKILNMPIFYFLKKFNIKKDINSILYENKIELIQVEYSQFSLITAFGRKTEKNFT